MNESNIFVRCYLLNVIGLLEAGGHGHPDMPEEETVVCNIRCAGAVIKSQPQTSG